MSRSDVLILRMLYRPSVGELWLRISSHANVWSDFGDVTESPEGVVTIPKKDPLELAAAERNVEFLVESVKRVLVAVPCERIEWSERLDGERPDRGSLMRTRLESDLGPASS